MKNNLITTLPLMHSVLTFPSWLLNRVGRMWIWNGQYKMITAPYTFIYQYLKCQKESGLDSHASKSLSRPPPFSFFVGQILLLQLLTLLFLVFSEDEKAKREVSSWSLEGDINTNPWSGYRYTGKLRPHYPLVSRRCHSAAALLNSVATTEWATPDLMTSHTSAERGELLNLNPMTRMCIAVLTVVHFSLACSISWYICN